MKICGVCILVSLLVGSALAQPVVPASVSWVVRDDAGLPISGVSVKGEFLQLSSTHKRSFFDGLTDSNGVYRVEGETEGGVFARFQKEGYYRTTLKTEIAADNYDLDAKGESVRAWSIEKSVVLKRKKNQIPMFIRTVENEWITPFKRVGEYRMEEVSAYDFVQGDFLAPHGNGIASDLIFKWGMTIDETNAAGLAVRYESRCEFMFANATDGLIARHPDGNPRAKLGSDFWSAYEAPADGYTNRLLIFERSDGAVTETNDDGRDLYYFRIRTQTNAVGEITNALYGQIRGRINGRFTYYLNPTPNDRNVEFDPKRNLFTNDTRLYPP